MQSAVRRARWRLWRQSAAQRLLRVLPYWLVILSVWIFAVRLALWPQAWDMAALAVLGAAVLGGLAHGLWHSHSDMQLARLLDERAGSYDALATSLWLAGQARRDGWVEVQAARAAEVANALNLSELLPWPRLNWRGGGAMLVVLTAAVFAPVPTEGGAGEAAGINPEIPSTHKGFATARAALGDDAAHLLTADVRLLHELEQQVDDDATRKWLGDLRQVVEAVQEGRIDKRQALEQLAALEAARPASADLPTDASASQTPGDADEAQRQRDVAARHAVADAVQKAVEQAPDGAVKDELKKAAEQGDLGLIAKALEKLADKDLSDKDIEKWRKTLEKFADALKDTKVPDKLKELAKKVSRLEQQRAEQGGLNPEQQRRLQEARHDLEQLRKETGDAEGAQHQVQRLERQARMAADELRRQQEQQGGRLGQKGEQGDKGADAQSGKDGGKQGEKPGEGKGQKAMQQAMRQAAGELRRQDNEQKARQAQRMGQERLRDVRQGLSRGGGDKQQGQGDKQGPGEPGDEGDEDGDQGEPRDGKGQKVQGKGDDGDKGQDGKKRPGSGKKGGKQSGEQGHDGKAEGSQPGGQKRGFELGQRGLGGKSRTDLINDGYEERQQGGGKGGKEAGTGKGDARQNGKDPGMQAARTEKVKGQQGDGPDVKKTFMDTAKKGFARQGWRDVYVDYSRVAEEMVDKEGLPAGRKALVRRYFEQIRPRD